MHISIQGKEQEKILLLVLHYTLDNLLQEFIFYWIFQL